AFSPELFRLIKGAQAHLANTGDAMLDFDPFIGGSDWPDRYVIDRARIKDDRCRAHNGNHNAELMFKDGRWFFVNFHYGKDGDLLSLLRKPLRGERRKTSQ